MNVAWPGPCSRKLATPIWESSERNTSTNDVCSMPSPSIERRRHSSVDRRLRQALRLQGAGGHLGGEGERPLVEILRATTSSARPMRRASSARTWRPVRHISLARLTPTVRGSRCVPAAARDDPEQDLRLAEHRLLRGDPVVARQRQLAAAAERVPADGGDHEPRDRGDGVEGGVEAGGDRGRLVRSAELGDVGAGGEDPLAARDHDGARRVGAQLVRDRRTSSASSADDSAFTLPLARVTTATPSSRRSTDSSCESAMPAILPDRRAQPRIDRIRSSRRPFRRRRRRASRRRPSTGRWCGRRPRR